MALLEVLKKRKNLLIVVVLLIAAVFLMSIFNTYSEDVSDSAWDGTVAKTFAGGTGTLENPYIISNANEFAYFKSLLEGEDANLYATKNYIITNGFNYGNYDLNINGEVTFTGTIDGKGNIIDNATINNAIFDNIEKATIKNIEFTNLKIKSTTNSGIVSNNSKDSTLETIIIEGRTDIEEQEEKINIAGLSYDDSNSNFNNIIVNIDSEKVNYSLFGTINESKINNILVKSNDKLTLNDDKLEGVSEFTINDEEIEVSDEILNNLNANNYKIELNNNKFKITFVAPKEESTEIKNIIPNKSPLRSAAITLHDSGVDGENIYINDLTADYNYYLAMDYTYFVDTGTIPNYTSLNKYGADKLVKVYMKYSGTDIAGSNTGYVSNTEQYSNYFYYKYYPVENGYINIPLIDNPYGRRPNNKVFMGWITDYEDAEISIDMDTYIRYVKIPVNNVNDVINITMYAIWGEGKIYEMTSAATINSTANRFSTGMVQIATTKTVKDYGNITDFSPYYVSRHINRYEDFPAGTYDQYLNVHTGNYSDYCRTNGGCDYYIRANSEYDETETYYILNAQTGASLVPYNNVTVSLYPNGIGGYFKPKNVNNGSSQEGYYNSDGEMQHGNCQRNGGCSLYELIQYYDGNGNINYVQNNTNYYYLTTRDTNILVLRTTPNRESNRYHRNTVPLTITSINNGSDYTSNAQLNISNAYVLAQEDLRIEHITMYSTGTGNAGDNASATSSLASNNIFGNYYNLKIGRGITGRTENSWYGGTTNYLSATGVYGGNVSAVSSLTKYTTIVETGLYNILGATGAAVSSSDNMYVNGVATWGNDLDRIRNNNTNLDVYFSTAGNWGGNLRSTNSNDIGVLQVIKSGNFGSSRNSYSCGVYAGGRGSQGTQHYVARSAIVEGGIIYNLIGGPFTATSRTNVNDSYLYVKGGTIDLIIGGAGLSTTYGNRIIAVTGGTVNYGVCGGSNGSSSTGANNQSGEVFGSTFVYIGGTAYIGGGTNTDLYGVEPGGVFGAGNGVSGIDKVGSVNNSNILINGGTIAGNVYGGGNFGATGYALSSGTTNTTIKMLAGTVNGSIYGGGNNNGSGKDGITAAIDIDINGGTVGDSVYGGSCHKGKVWGSTDVAIGGATITNSVYGGGEGGYQDDDDYGTYVRDSVTVTINSGTIGNSVYGGSAYGSVNTINETNTTSSYNTNVVVNGGVVTNSVFGGGKGGTEDGVSYTPKVIGNINVQINGGDVANVFGGNDQAGTHDKQNEVHLNGGIVGNAYGGGNRSSVTNTHVYLSGSTVTNIYGGSNTLGDVNTTTVLASSGSVQNIYGGNNEGGTCTTTNVTITGTASINGSLYGGGNQVNTATTNVNLNSANGAIPNVYGGGNSASVTTANVTNNGVTANNLFGGSNSSGTVTTANITYNSGTSTNIYGGNNAGGNTVAAHIDFKNGTTTNLFGGGNQANGGTADIIVRNGTVNNLFGGGNSAGLNETDIHVINGSFTNIYGGSNNAGNVPVTTILIDSTNNQVTAVYGGGNNAPVGASDLTIDGGTFTNVYGGGNLAQVNGNSLVDINGGTINGSIYGGGNYGAVNGNSTVTITNATILGSAYAGGNGATATVTGNTNITIDGSTVIGTNASVPPASGSVFGGGNQAYTGTQNMNITSNVNIVGGTIYGNVYGGANTSVIYGNTNVNIGAQALNDSSLIKSNIYIKGHIFGGGEANASGSEIYDWNFISVTEGTNIIVDGTNYNSLTIGGSFYGGGNASSASGDSYLLIKNYGTTNNPKRNVSIQRVDYVTIDHSSILLKGAIDRANDYDTELFSISRVLNLKIKNNTELYLETGANLLEQFESLDSSNNYAVVTINENNNTLTRTVDNRVYMYEGKNLNIAKDQQVTDYGEVKGMSFLGMYNYDNDNNVNTGIYNSTYNPGDTLPWSGTFSRGSYVLGAHTTNHNIKVNGFYSNFINEDTTINEVNYINPTPESGYFYMWFIGENVIEYNVNLVASKYSTLGSVETSFLEFSKPNTSFQILSFDSSEMASGISLIDKNNIPRIAATDNDANTKFGLSMESSNTGWLTFGKTSFYTREPSISGTTYYEGENSNVVPTMLFYLYHSKNITQTQDLGTVRISVMAITKLNALSNEIKRLVINVNMSTRMFNTVEYEGAMAPGDKYELFAATNTNITTKSKLSAYYGIFAANTNLYRTGYKRVLTSTFVLPVGTKLTMIDFGGTNPEYYYHVIDTNDYNTALSEYNLNSEASYPLSLFTKMGSKSNNSNYNDATQNSIYYDGTNTTEEFIFIVDYGDANITQNQLNKKLLIELRDSSNDTIISVLGIQHSQLTYNLYANSDASLDVTITPSDNPLYIGYTDTFDMVLDYEATTLNGVSITDTQNFDNKLGAQISIKNSLGNVLSGTDLTGTYFMVDGVRYYPDINGYTHIKLANKVGNTEKWLMFNTENSTLASGSYTFDIEIFASPDGVYYSSGEPEVKHIPITIISSIYGLNPVLDQNSVVFSANNDKNLKFTIHYTSLLTDPNIRIEMYRRKYDTVYDTNYELVDFQDYIDQQLFGTETENQYLLIDDPNATNEFTLLMNDELLTGTYRLVFSLYDNDTKIGDIIRYIIIR